MEALTSGIIPNNPADLIELGANIYARHCVLGSNSPLLCMQSNSWEVTGPKVEPARRLLELIKQDSKPAHLNWSVLNELLNQIRLSVEATLVFLMAQNAENTELLAYWGFNTAIDADKQVNA
ncbi:MAG: hypothetical protein PHR83_12410 [Paludibacter sp.]|nr:hypothetical protein [Paludibacter sp.]